VIDRADSHRRSYYSAPPRDIIARAQTLSGALCYNRPVMNRFLVVARFAPIALLVACDAPVATDAGRDDVRTRTDAAPLDALDSAAPDVGALDVAADAPVEDAALDVVVSDVLSDTGVDARPPLRIPHSASVLVGIIGTGQSLSVGATSTPALTTRQRYENVRLRDMGTPPLYDGVGDRLSLVPLVEPVRSDVSGGTQLYPNNIAGETPHGAMAHELSFDALRRAGVQFATAHIVVGESGRPMDFIRRGGTGRAYASSIYETTAIATLARNEARRFEVGAVILTHGESDWNNSNYATAVRALADAYRMDIPSITMQRSEIPLIHSQQGTFPGQVGRGQSTLLQWQASVENRGVVILSGPKYQLEYSADRIHLTAAGSRSLGIAYARAYAQTMFEGRPWRPLEPVAARRVGADVEVEFHVPSPPLAWEESIPQPHTTTHPTSGAPPTIWARGRGFELEQAGRAITIQSVSIRGNFVVISPATPLSPGDFSVRYAMTQDAPGYTGGTPWARAGQLRDSDPYVGHDRVTVMAAVTERSNVLRVTSGSLDGHATRALVRGAGLPPSGAVVTAATGAMLTLASPWSGPSGTVPIEVQSDQRNYAVHFEIVGR
jgi:hypothetical protein